MSRRNVKSPERIVLLNDTVATLLSGVVNIPARGELTGECKYKEESGPVIGFILGTGFNTAYPETDIPKINFSSTDSPQIVVCESGNFAHRYRGILDRKFDAGTKNPGTFNLEKTTSGAYLGPLTFCVMKQAIEDGVLRFRKSDDFLNWQTMQTVDLSAFLHSPLSKEGAIASLFGDDELPALRAFSYIASIVSERAAIFSAAMLAATVKRVNWHNPFAPVRIAVEGTTYMHFKGMRKSIESHFHTMLVDDKPMSYMIVPVEQASLFGAAVAALSK